MLISFILARGEKIMKETIKNNIKYIIFLAFSGLVGGYFTGMDVSSFKGKLNPVRDFVDGWVP